MDDLIPNLILLLKEPKVVSIEQAEEAVNAVLGPEPAATVRLVGENTDGMRYITWQVGTTPYHLGTCREPYLNKLGTGKVGQPIRWTLREEVPPHEERHAEPWMAHEAWMYIDALALGRDARPAAHLPNVLRIASHFIDDACLLLWLWGGVLKHVSLPTPRVRKALSNGRWLEE
jgi:hypothetical protein